VLDIYDVLDVSGNPVDCNKPLCSRIGVCACSELWEDMKQAIRKVLQSRNLRELSDREDELAQQSKKSLSPLDMLVSP